MNIADAIDRYAFRRMLCESTRRKLRYELNEWVSCGGSVETLNITAIHVEEWRHAALRVGHSPRTIESVIATVRILAAECGHLVSVGEKLRYVPQPKGVPSFSDFSRVVAAGSPWWRWWLCFAYSTGLRLGDLERVEPAAEVVIVTAKARKRQVIPVPAPVLRLQSGRLKMCRKTLRQSLRSLCESVGVPSFTPQQVRQLSAVEWERARPGCGAVILGHAIPGWSAATAYYLDRSDQLHMGLPNLRLPPSILTDEERSAEKNGEIRLIATYHRLHPQQRSALVEVATAMG